MAHPLKHTQSSVKRFGGKPEDYLAIHNWFDESKAFLADFRHRGQETVPTETVNRAGRQAVDTAP